MRMSRRDIACADSGWNELEGSRNDTLPKPSVDCVDLFGTLGKGLLNPVVRRADPVKYSFCVIQT